MVTIAVNHASAPASFSWPVDDDGSDLSLTAAEEIAGTLGYPSKMPGTSYGIPATRCITGAKLHAVTGSTCHDCYALNANYQYPSVHKAQAKRFASLRHPRWVAAVTRLLQHMHSPDSHGRSQRGRNGRIVSGWHRWHDAGDLQSVQHLANICAVAQQTPEIWHWLPTREGTIVKRYVDAGGIIPENMCIRISATMIDGPAPSWRPQTSGVHHKRPAQGVDCSARFNNGQCGPCRACWNREVKHVEYAFH